MTQEAAGSLPGARGFFDEKGRYSGIRGWIFSTDHKRIGLLYLGSMAVFFITAVTLGVLMRLEMLSPGRTIMEPQTYNTLFTLHGIMMIFLFIIPGLPAVFGNFLLPILIGAKDVFFPRLNLLSWWLFLAGGVLALVSVFLPGGAADTGWTFYVPYSVRTSTNVIPALFAAFILGFSSILTGLNFVTTIHRMRAPGMDWFKMPLFVWSLYATAWIQILATPIIGITLVAGCHRTDVWCRYLRPVAGRRPGSLSTSFLDLFASGGLYHDPAGSGRRVGSHPGLRAPDDLRLQVHRVLQPCYRVLRIPGLGTSHVHGRDEQHGDVHLLSAHLPGLDPERDQDLQLDRHAVQRVDRPRGADCSSSCRSSFNSRSAGSRD